MPHVEPPRMHSIQTQYWDKHKEIYNEEKRQYRLDNKDEYNEKRRSRCQENKEISKHIITNINNE